MAYYMPINTRTIYRTCHSVAKVVLAHLDLEPEAYRYAALKHTLLLYHDLTTAPANADFLSLVHASFPAEAFADPMAFSLDFYLLQYLPIFQSCGLNLT